MGQFTDWSDWVMVVVMSVLQQQNPQDCYCCISTTVLLSGCATASCDPLPAVVGTDLY